VVSQFVEDNPPIEMSFEFETNEAIETNQSVQNNEIDVSLSKQIEGISITISETKPITPVFLGRWDISNSEDDIDDDDEFQFGIVSTDNQQSAQHQVGISEIPISNSANDDELVEMPKQNSFEVIYNETNLISSHTSESITEKIETQIHFKSDFDFSKEPQSSDFISFNENNDTKIPSLDIKQENFDHDFTINQNNFVSSANEPIEQSKLNNNENNQFKNETKNNQEKILISQINQDKQTISPINPDVSLLSPLNHSGTYYQDEFSYEHPQPSNDSMCQPANLGIPKQDNKQLSEKTIDPTNQSQKSQVQPMQMYSPHLYPQVFAHPTKYHESTSSHHKTSGNLQSQQQQQQTYQQQQQYQHYAHSQPNYMNQYVQPQMYPYFPPGASFPANLFIPNVSAYFPRSGIYQNPPRGYPIPHYPATFPPLEGYSITQPPQYTHDVFNSSGYQPLAESKSNTGSSPRMDVTAETSHQNKLNSYDYNTTAIPGFPTQPDDSLSQWNTYPRQMNPWNVMPGNPMLNVPLSQSTIPAMYENSQNSSVAKRTKKSVGKMTK